MEFGARRSSHLQLVDAAALGNAGDLVFEAMVDGWRKERIGRRGLDPVSTAAYVATVRRFRSHAQSEPWEWTAALFDDWMTDLVADRKHAKSTLRSYQDRVRAFCVYATSSNYEWMELCQERFGAQPRQVADLETSRRHLQGYEGGPGRLVMTRDELDTFFRYCDDRVDEIVADGRKGAFAAYRFAAAAKAAYGWGLRAQEVAGLDVTDFYRNPRRPEHGERGMLLVRNGKSSQGSAPRRRPVVTVFGWGPAVIQDYIDNVWSSAQLPGSNALWTSERGTRMAKRDLSDRFASYRDALGLPASLTFHALRRSYATHLFEDGVDVEFIRRQLGHVYLTTTLQYIHASEAAANRLMDAALDSIGAAHMTGEGS